MQLGRVSAAGPDRELGEKAVAAGEGVGAAQAAAQQAEGAGVERSAFRHPEAAGNRGRLPGPGADAEKGADVSDGDAEAEGSDAEEVL